MGVIEAERSVKAAEAAPQWTVMPVFLALGGTPPALDRIKFVQGAGSPWDGIVLLGRVEQAELDRVLKEAPDAAVPIADFGENLALRRDFSRPALDQQAILEMKERFGPIWRRLADLPFIAERQERDDMLILRLAYSRATPIEAAFAPDTQTVVAYPLLGRSAGIRRQLELLADLQMLKRRHFTRTHSCAKCNSARLNVCEVCPACGGSDLKEEPIVHHYRCGCQEPQSHFAHGEMLICPKCRRTLHHFGVDYDKPGESIICRTCGATNSQPDVTFVCLDCNHVTPSDDAETIDWHHYDLTEEGLRALRSGRLPKFEIASLLERRTRALSPSEFRLLAMYEMKRSKRYERGFSVVRLSFKNIEAIRKEVGFAEADHAFETGVDAIVATLRGSDFVGARGAVSVAIGMPETSLKDARAIAGRVQQVVREKTSLPIVIDLDMAEGEAIVEMLEQG